MFDRVSVRTISKFSEQICVFTQHISIGCDVKNEMEERVLHAVWYFLVNCCVWAGSLPLCLYRGKAQADKLFQRLSIDCCSPCCSQDLCCSWGTCLTLCVTCCIACEENEAFKSNIGQHKHLDWDTSEEIRFESHFKQPPNVGFMCFFCCPNILKSVCIQSG